MTVSEFIPLIKDMGEVYSVSVDGNWNEVELEDVSEMMNDYYVLLSDKEFIEKWNDKYGFSPTLDYDSNDNYEEMYLPMYFYIDFEDGGEVIWDFSDWREDTEGNLFVQQESEQAKAFLEATGSDDGWDIDINELMNKVKENKK